MRLFTLLNINRSEKSLVLWSLLFSFLFGAISAYLGAIPMSLFLTEFSSASLPLVYLGYAILVMLIGGVYSWIEPKLSFKQLNKGLFVFSLVITLISGLILVNSHDRRFTALLAIWGLTLFELLYLGLWSVFNRIYNIQQAKRLFGLLGASQCVAGMLAGFTLPLLLDWISPEEMVLFISLLIFLSIWPLSVLINTTNEEELPEREVNSPEEIQPTLKSIFQEKYILKLLALVALGIFIAEIVDILFNTVAKEHYPTDVTLAGFFGLFYGFCDGLNLVLGFVYGGLLRRIGVIKSLMILPLALLVFAGFSLITTLSLLLTAYVFWSFVGLMLNENVLRTSISEVSHLLLFQPLPPRLSTYVLTKSNTLVVPIATIFISLCLYAITHFHGVPKIELLSIVLLCTVLTILIIASLKKEYLQTLYKAIANRFVLGNSLPKLTADSIPILEQALASPNPELVIYALSNIELIDKAHFIRSLHTGFRSQNIAVRQYVLQKINEYQLKEFKDELFALLDQERNLSLREQTIYTLAELDYPQAQTTIHKLMNHASQRISCAAMISLYRFGSMNTQEEVSEKIHNMLVSSEDKVRQAAAFVIGEVNESKINYLLGTLLEDPSKRVRREVLRSIIKTKQVELFSDLLRQLDLIPLRGEILSQFIDLNPLLMPVIQTHFSSYKTAIKIKLLKSMGAVASNAVFNFLGLIANNNTGYLKQTALRSLVKIKPSADNQLAHLDEKITEEVKSLNQQENTLLQTPNTPLTQLLYDTLHRKMMLTIERLMLLISLYYGNPILEQVQIILLTGTTDEISHALELLEGILTPSHKKLIIPQLTTIYFTEREGSVALDSHDFHKVLKSQLQPDDHEDLTVLACIASLYVINSFGKRAFQTELEELERNESTIIQETLAWMN